jgi:hypothetical protein
VRASSQFVTTIVPDESIVRLIREVRGSPSWIGKHAPRLRTSGSDAAISDFFISM